MMIRQAHIPKGWEIKILKDIGNVFSGNSINAKVKKDKYLNYPDGLPYVATKDVGYDCLIDYENGIKIPHSEKELFRIAPKNSVLICAEGGSAGRKMGIINQDICFVNKLFAITPESETTSRYLFYWYQTNEFQIEFKSRLTGLIGGVSKKKFETIPIPIPPLEEQKRIVAKLDQCFEAIDKARTNMERNLQNAKELFQSKLNEIFSQKGDGWKEKKLGEVSENLDSKRIPITKNKRQSGTVPYYGASGIVDYVASHIFNEDLLLVSEDGANLLARTYPIAFSISGKTWVNNHAHVLKFKNFKSQKFVEYYLNSIKLDNYVSGMAQPKLNQKMLNSIPLPFPDIETQEHFVNIINKLKAQTQSLESNYQQELNALDELKKSILQKAFNGEL